MAKSKIIELMCVLLQFHVRIIFLARTWFYATISTTFTERTGQIRSVGVIFLAPTELLKKSLNEMLQSLLLYFKDYDIYHSQESWNIQCCSKGSKLVASSNAVLEHLKDTSQDKVASLKIALHSSIEPSFCLAVSSGVTANNQSFVFENLHGFHCILYIY